MKTYKLLFLLPILSFQNPRQTNLIYQSTAIKSEYQFEEFVRTINYKTWDGSNWSADLEDLHWINGPFGVWNVSDPDFQHHGVDNHNSDFIDYLSDAGEKWRSKCHAHSNLSGDVWFTFEHFREGNENDKHEDNILNYRDWNGNKWQITIPMRDVDVDPADAKKIGTTDPKVIMFIRRRIP